MATPHRVVDSALDGLADGAAGVARTVAGGLKGAGEAVMVALDRPLREVVGVEGPHRIIDRALDGSVDAAENFYTRGVVDSLKTAGEGISRGLDHPPEQVGIPPELGAGFRGPRFLRR